MAVPYTKSPGSIPRLMEHIQSAGVPDKVSVKYLKSAGFTSSNDSYLLGLLKGIGFLDGSGSPTARWKAYRDKSRAGGVLAEAVKQGYADLFQIYPDAYRRDDEAITNFIRGHSDYSNDTVTRALGSFKALCALADFSDTDASPSHSESEQPAVAGTGPILSSVAGPSLPGTPQVTINIELQLPASADASVYDDFFSAMRKHLFDGSEAS